LPRITPREREVLRLVVGGRGNKAIAEEMRIGEQAVKAHISRLFLKFRVENRAGLAVAAMSEELHQRSAAVRDLERLAREERRDALRTRAKLLRSLVGKDPAVVVGRDGRVLLANPAFQRTFAAALYQDERGVKLPADATPLARAAHNRPASIRFKLASGPRKGTWWHATGEKVEFAGVGGWTVVVFRAVRGPRR
jgi:DNA-binding CsgD family transcriptional regulator